jgi:acetyltransferase-like isoleucine patch superfamily enzyme
MYLLGYSEATISRILDALESRGYRDPVTIVRNMEVETTHPFQTGGIPATTRDWKDVHFDLDRGKCILAAANPVTKWKVFEFFEKNCGIRRIDYASLSHASTVIASTVKQEEGSFVEPGAVIASYAKLGFSSYINRNCSIGHHAEIGDFVMTGPGCHIAGHCRIGNSVKLGIGALVFDHVSIGENSIIGGGSLVNRDIPANVMAWGNPCKVIRKIETNE